MFSKSIVAIVVSFLGIVAGLFGLDVPEEVKTAITEHAYGIIIGGIGLYGLGKVIVEQYRKRKAN